MGNSGRIGSAQTAKRRVDVSLKPKERGPLRAAVELIEAHARRAEKDWPQMPERARRELLEKAPLLARIVAIGERFR